MKTLVVGFLLALATPLAAQEQPYPGPIQESADWAAQYANRCEERGGIYRAGPVVRVCGPMVHYLLEHFLPHSLPSRVKGCRIQGVNVAGSAPMIGIRCEANEDNWKRLGRGVYEFPWAIDGRSFHPRAEDWIRAGGFLNDSNDNSINDLIELIICGSIVCDPPVEIEERIN